MVAGATVVLVTASVAIAIAAGTSWPDLLASYAPAASVMCLLFGLTGSLVLRDAPGNVIGPLLSTMGLWAGVGVLGGLVWSWFPPDSVPAAVAAGVNGLWIPLVLGFLSIPFLFPHGELVSTPFRIPFRVFVASSSIAVLAFLMSPHLVDGFPGTANPLSSAVPADLPTGVAIVGVSLAVALSLAALVGQLRRMRRTSGDERARIAWLAAAVLLLLLGIAGSTPIVALGLDLLAFACLVLGIVRHQMFDIERILSRSVVYALVVGLALLAAFATAALLGSLSGVGVLPAVAAAVTAVLLAGAFSRLQRGVDRLLFGPRQDAGHVLGVLGDRLAAATDPEDALVRLVSTIREVLRLPYAAVAIAGEVGNAIEDGQRQDLTRSFPLRYGGQEVGSLVIGARAGATSLSARDTLLLQTLASQAGAVTHSAQTMRDLRRSREQLVSAREEERRALRRDLHDGLGPTLAGMSLGLQSLERGATDEDQARLAADLLAQSRQSLEEVRRMARDLRPAALDELGLADALRQHAQTVRRMSAGALDVVVTIAGDLPEPPAAVEVAAYRISQEALSNATRHSGATRCALDLSVNGSLVLSIADDGSGAAPDSAGTGLRSMRERADEVGGICTVTFRPGVGTEVLALLPVGVPS